MYIEYEFIAATFPYYTIKDTYVCTLNYCCQDVKFDFSSSSKSEQNMD